MFDRMDRYIGIVFALFGTYFYYLSTTWKPNYTADPAGPAAIPKILCVGIIILGVILAVGGFFVKKKDEKPFVTKTELITTGLMLVVCILYIVSLSYIGYLIATPLLIAAILLILGVRKPLSIVLISVIGTLVLFVLFYSVLRVNLPLAFMKNFIKSFMPRL